MGDSERTKHVRDSITYWKKKSPKRRIKTKKGKKRGQRSPWG